MGQMLWKPEEMNLFQSWVLLKPNMKLFYFAGKYGHDYFDLFTDFHILTKYTYRTFRNLPEKMASLTGENTQKEIEWIG